MKKRPNRQQPDPSAPLANTRWEAFAVLVAKGVKASDAYRKMYPRSNDWRSSCLHREASVLHRKVLGRVEHLRAKMTEDDVWTVKEKLSALAKKGRRAMNGLRNVLTILPDGTRVIEVNEENADLVHKATSRVETSGRGDGAQDACFVNVEMVKDLDYMQEHSKLAGHYPDTKMTLQNPDGTPVELPEIVFVRTHATAHRTPKRKK